MQLTERLSYALIIAIVILFVVDSTSLIQDFGNSYIAFILGFSLILFASAYNSAKSFDNPDFWKKTLIRLYLPYTLIAIFAVLIQMWKPTLQIWLLALTPASIFQATKPEGFGYLWLFPMLFALLIWFSLMHKYIPSDKVKAAIIVTIWALAFFGILYNLPVSFIDEFPLLLPIFSFGYFAGKERLNKFFITNKTELFIITIFALMAVTGVYAYFSPTIIYQSIAERFLTHYVPAMFLGITSTLILIYLFKNAKANKLVIMVSSAALLIYLIEPCVSSFIGYYLYGQGDYYHFLTENWVFQIIRIPTVILSAVAINGLLDRLESASLKHPRS